MISTSRWIILSLRTMAVLVVLTVPACSSDDGEQSRSCGEDETFNPVTGECDLEYRRSGEPDTTAVDADTGAPTDAADTRTVSPDSSSTDTHSTADSGKDATADTATDAGACDRDDDGVRDERCGGPDCDGDDPGVRPDAPELCDGKDNDCDGEVDEDVDCSFYAHGRSTLYKVDPFAKSISKQNASQAPARSFLDIDTHPDGDLWALTGSSLYRLPDGGDTWQNEGRVRGLTGANGMAIDRRGTAFLTAGSSLYKLDLDESASSYNATELGNMGGGYRSSGDCVVNKKGTLLMTSSDPDGGGNDVLVELDQRTGDATEIGPTDHDAIWGLTSGWSKLYGTTSGGELITIDPADGSSQTVDTFSGPSFYGAASTPASRRRDP